MQTTVYFFARFCSSCNRRIEYPLLGDFSYGELVFQTVDGLHFAHVDLLDNTAFEYLIAYTESLKNKKADPQKLLAFIADSIDNQKLSYKIICPYCSKRQRNFLETYSKREVLIPSATWHNFNKLSTLEKDNFINAILKENL